jgi:hypothetical protein
LSAPKIRCSSENTAPVLYQNYSTVGTKSQSEYQNPLALRAGMRKAPAEADALKIILSS